MIDAAAPAGGADDDDDAPVAAAADATVAAPVAAAPAVAPAPAAVDDALAWLDSPDVAPAAAAAPVVAAPASSTEDLIAQVARRVAAEMAAARSPSDATPDEPEEVDPVVHAAVTRALAEQRKADEATRLQSQAQADLVAWTKSFDAAVSSSKVFAGCADESERAAYRKLYQKALWVERQEVYQATGRDLSPAQAANVVSGVDAPIIAAMRRTKRAVINARVAPAPVPLAGGSAAVGRVDVATGGAPVDAAAPFTPPRQGAPARQAVESPETWARNVAAEFNASTARASRGR